MNTALKIISIAFIVIGAFIVYGAGYISKKIKTENDSGEAEGSNSGDDQKVLNIKKVGACFVIAGAVIAIAAFR
ncbi:MAG TPA: hypothetical protein DCE11_04995 [Ruminiclostridium sp.]|nr:hypothetical protein [Clostridiaceae bacterium]HAA25462.1 hypothetical protein [Ruminiclostridium sp.]